jgi:NADPH:quinone reductase-like Zn-dependent oxidoreductase
MTYKAAVLLAFGKPDNIVIQTLTLPALQQGQVLIKVEASSVGTDTLIRKGFYPLLKDKPPFTMGYELVGKIVETHPSVLAWKKGDRVCAMLQIGANAEFAIADVTQLVKVASLAEPEKVLCTFISGLTAFQMLHHVAKVKKGNTLLVHGAAGGVGNSLIQIGHQLGCQVVATASIKKHLHLQHLDANLVDYKADNIENQLKNLAPNGYDATFDFTNHTSFNRSFRLLKKEGKLVTYGILGTAEKAEHKTFFTFLQFGLEFGWMMGKIAWWNRFSKPKSAAFFGVVDAFKANPTQFQADFDQLNQWLDAGKIQPLIAKIFPLEQVAEAHRFFDNGDKIGQIIIKNNGKK